MLAEPASEDRVQLAEALCHLSHAAKRTFARVGSPDLPTPWDLCHQRIDDHLTLWELAADR